MKKVQMKTYFGKIRCKRYWHDFEVRYKSAYIAAFFNWSGNWCSELQLPHCGAAVDEPLQKTVHNSACLLRRSSTAAFLINTSCGATIEVRHHSRRALQ